MDDKQSLNISELAYRIAVTQLGVHEATGHRNTGEQVKIYQLSTGNSPGDSWCMSFAYWCYLQAATAQGVKNPLIKTGGVLSQWNLQLPRRRVLQQTARTNPEVIKRGSIFIMDFGSGKGHTGLVESFDGRIVHTIEGNSNDDGSRDGYEVCRKPNGRHIATIKGFIII